MSICQKHAIKNSSINDSLCSYFTMLYQLPRLFNIKRDTMIENEYSDMLKEIKQPSYLT
jgi:hypothetical protein